MAKLVQQSTTADPLFFFLTSSSDHITGLTGKAGTVTVEISKNGASGVTPGGAISEIDSTNLPGWYAVAGNATDTGTLGEILLHASVSGADPCDMIVAQVVAFNPRTGNLGLSNVPVNVAQWNGSSVVAPATAGIPDINVKNYNNQTAVTDANNLPKVDMEDIAGASTGVSSLSKAVGNIGRGTCTTGGTTTSIPTSSFSPGGASIVSGQFIGRTIIFDGNTSTAALQGQASNITANTSGSTPTFTVSALTTAPSSGDTFSVV